ncbi:MAG: histidine kinase [Cyclobacteriaceae bacterium]|nr:histidine kinase [Cyclobacteriaceae bacterium]
MNFRQFFARNEIIIHILFWIISFYSLLNHFSIASEIQPIDYLYTLLFHISILTVVYLNLYALIPRFLERQHYGIYGITLVLLFGVFYGIHVFTFDVLSKILFPDYFLITFYNYDDLLIYFAIYIGSTTLFVLSRYWFEILDSKKKLAEAEKEKIHHELKSLKAQVNPHFLFNSLNTIYSLALKKSDNTAEVIVKLADVLRYIIYESNAEKVELQKELDFIKKYIDLQKLRTNAANAIQFTETGEIGSQMVAPLIFIVFIENAFKHGPKGDTENQFLHIRFDISTKDIVFLVENNLGKCAEIENNQFKGLGLENVRRRLELMYPGKHYLAISDNNDKFMIRLELQL